MIKPPSQQFEYTLIFSGDPALNLPEDKEERAKALEVARETGQWATVLHVGQVPTTFRVRPITGPLLDWMSGEIQRRKLLNHEAAPFALRLALVGIEGFGEHKVESERAGVDGEFKIATLKIIEALYSVDGVGRDVVQELGSLVMARAYGALGPKS